MYKIIYLPIAQRDLEGIIGYIADFEKEPINALSLLDAFDEAIGRLKQFPYSCQVYIPIREIEYEYRLLPVKGYGVYYTIYEEKKIVEIHRILSQRMDVPNIIW